MSRLYLRTTRKKKLGGVKSGKQDSHAEVLATQSINRAGCHPAVIYVIIHLNIISISQVKMKQNLFQNRINP